MNTPVKIEVGKWKLEILEDDREVLNVYVYSPNGSEIVNTLNEGDGRGMGMVFKTIDNPPSGKCSHCGREMPDHAAWCIVMD